LVGHSCVAQAPTAAATPRRRPRARLNLGQTPRHVLRRAAGEGPRQVRLDDDDRRPVGVARPLQRALEIEDRLDLLAWAPRPARAAKSIDGASGPRNC
jgi:hypothetical protein